MWNQKPCFRFEIDNFSEKEAAIDSKTFVSGGCEWHLRVYPKGESLDGHHLSLFLRVANTQSLRTGWTRRARFYFVLFNKLDKEFYRSHILGEKGNVFCAETIGLGKSKRLPLSKFQEKGFLENDRLIIEVYIKIIEVVDGESINVSEKEETVDINGFQVFASQVTSVKKIFEEHPDIAKGLKPKNPIVKTSYINVLFNLIETLQKPSQSLLEIELSNAHSELNELMELGFKLDWLKTKLEEVSLERKKANPDGLWLWIQKLEERIKYLELTVSDLKVEADMEKAKSTTTSSAHVLSLEQALSDLKVELEKERDKSATSTARVLWLEDLIANK